MKHLKNNNETYLSHFFFATKIGITLVLRGIVFLFHGVLPLGNIPAKWNLETTALKLQEWNKHTDKRSQK